MPFRTMSQYANTSGVAGVASNASWVGPWVNIEGATSIGVQVVLTATGSPTATWGADVTDDERQEVNSLADSGLRPGVTPLTALSIMTSNNPAGTTDDRNFLAQFDPGPRAKWFRFKYTRASGGDAGLLLKVGLSMFGGAA